MLWKKSLKSSKEVVTYDKENWKPVMRCSICNGEKVAGLKNIRTGEFRDGTLIKDEKDLKNFMKKYGVEEVIKEY